MYAIKSLKIARFIVQETGTYNDQFRRPYETNLNDQQLNIILDSVDRAKSVTATALAGISASFVTPSVAPEAPVGIIGGWQERRLRFFLELHAEDHIGSGKILYVTGYSDHAGISFGGHLDPMMRFFINDIHTARRDLTMNPMGRSVQNLLIDSSQVVTNNQFYDISQPNKLYGLRPEDVYAEIQSADLNDDGQDGFIIDGRALITSGPKKVKRQHSIAPVYMSNLLDTYLQTSRDDAYGSPSQILESSMSAVRAPSVHLDPFLDWLSRNGSAAHGVPSATFTLSDLRRLDAGVDAVTHTQFIGQTRMALMHQAGQTENWNGTNLETLVATSLSQSISGYMLHYSFNKIHLLCTNHSHGGLIDTKILDAKSLMQGVDLSQPLDALKFRIETELMRSISHDNQIAFAVEVQCDLMGETLLEVSINGQSPIRYVTPSFCDALMVPVVTSNIQRSRVIAHDFRQVMEGIVDNSRHGQGAAQLMSGGSTGY